MRLDLFPWIMFACWALFLPPPFWDALAAIVAWNAGELSGAPSPALGAVLRPLGLTQRWSMFSPDPARDDGWIVAEAQLESGAKVDLLNGGPPTRDRPRVRRDLRWRSYLALVARDGSGDMATFFAR
ncbi:MAG: hypothetical protein KIT84_30710 [Labilithrix sp.]|nr:hypothetical protein [Labilithrix sp.]MCW5815439.1 hypothetical protein [Labilithrix sp.]